MPAPFQSPFRKSPSASANFSFSTRHLPHVYMRPLAFEHLGVPHQCCIHNYAQDGPRRSRRSSCLCRKLLNVCPEGARILSAAEERRFTTNAAFDAYFVLASLKTVRHSAAFKTNAGCLWPGPGMVSSLNGELVPWCWFSAFQRCGKTGGKFGGGQGCGNGGEERQVAEEKT